MKSPVGADGKPLFASGFFSLIPIVPGQADSAPVLESGTLEGPEWRAMLEHLAPGAYNLYVRTTPREGAATRPDLQARAGEYHDLHKLELKPGERVSVAFDPPPFNPDAWRGKLSAAVVVSPAGNRTLAGEDYRVSYGLPNYGFLSVAKGKLRADGRIALENIAPSGTSPFGGQYRVEVGGEYLGEFRVKDQPARQEFPFRMPVRTGDLAADGEAQDITTGQAGPDRRLPRPGPLPRVLGDVVRALPRTDAAPGRARQEPWRGMAKRCRAGRGQHRQ